MKDDNSSILVLETFEESSVGTILIRATERAIREMSTPFWGAGTKFTSSKSPGIVYTLAEMTGGNGPERWYADYYWNGKATRTLIYSTSEVRKRFEMGVWSVFHDKFVSEDPAPNWSNWGHGTQFKFRNEGTVYTIEKRPTGEFTVTWPQLLNRTNRGLSYSVEEINENFRTGLWVMVESPVWWEGSKFQNAASGSVYTVEKELYLKNKEWRIRWGLSGRDSDSALYSTEQINQYLKEGVWTLLEAKDTSSAPPRKESKPEFDRLGWYVDQQFTWLGHTYPDLIFRVTRIDENVQVLNTKTDDVYSFSVSDALDFITCGDWVKVPRTTFWGQGTVFTTPQGAVFILDFSSYRQWRIYDSEGTYAAVIYTPETIDRYFSEGIWKKVDMKAEEKIESWPVGTLFWRNGHHDTCPYEITFVGTNGVIIRAVNTRSLGEERIYDHREVRDKIATGEWTKAKSMKKVEMPRPGPDHYATNGVQPIDLIRDAGLSFEEGNVVKYVARWRKKDGLADLLKAKQYLDWLIESAEKVNGKIS